ncbi:sensor histidine kinase [Hydrogenobacter thermophilus]|uniref:sensor histidine kinase n=1 Tax=Hydrogenobacter thermophilus TaxID=940 RepID=UPI0030F910AC
MRLRSLKLLAYFFMTLFISLSVTNTLIFYYLKNLADDILYEQAYTQYMAYIISNGAYRGDQNFTISEKYTDKYLSYVFRDPSSPERFIYVKVKPDYERKFVRDPFKVILMSQFVTVFLILLVYQFIIEDSLNKIEKQEEWTKSLVASVAHKFGNFLSVQKVNLALLKVRVKDEDILRRLERSLSRVEKDMNLILHVLREERQMKMEWLRVDNIILETIKEFEEELSNKRLFLGLKEVYIYGDESDIRDIFYNIISNGVRYSKSFFHIKVCKSNEAVNFVFRNDIGFNERKGLGVGSILLEQIVKRQGGTIRISIKNHYAILLKLKGR